jgi:hypothetical protein
MTLVGTTIQAIAPRARGDGDEAVHAGTDTRHFATPPHGHRGMIVRGQREHSAGKTFGKPRSRPSNTCSRDASCGHQVKSREITVFKGRAIGPPALRQGAHASPDLAVGNGHDAQTMMQGTLSSFLGVQKSEKWSVRSLMIEN